MKKMSKICSLLLMVPVLGAGSLLAGCGKDKASKDQIIKTYNAMIQSTQKANADLDKAVNNEIFTYSKNANALDKKTYDYLQVANDNGANVNFEVELGILDVNDSNNKADEETVLYNLYDHLNTVYGSLLDASNRYFYYYQDDLLNSETNIDGKALKPLLEKTEKLSSAVKSFYANLKDRQDLAEFLSSDTQVMSSKLKTFNSSYVNLINANFEFNIEFCNVHNKYVLKDDMAIKGTAERLAREAALKYAYGYFLDNIKPYQHNNLCDTADFLNVPNKDKETFYKNDEFSKLFDFKVEASYTNNDIGYLKVLDDAGSWKYRGVEDLSNTLYSELSTKFETLRQVVDRFDVFLKLYKDNASKFDMYSYNELRTGDADSTLYSSLQDFKNSLSAEQTARLEVIENFTSYDMEVLLSVLNDILVGTGYTGA